MEPHAQGLPDLQRLLEVAAAAPPVLAVEALLQTVRGALGCTGTAFFLVDVSGHAAVRLTAGAQGRATVPLADTEYETVVRSGRPLRLDDRPGCRVLLPVAEHGDVIGILEVDLPAPPSAKQEVGLRTAAAAVAYAVLAASRFTDLLAWGQRSTPRTLAAEMQRRLLPPALTYEGPAFTVACALEPAASIGGDTFDYSVEPGCLHVSLTDAMGHEERSALLASLAVGSLRNSRRRGASMLEQAAAANEALVEHGQGDEYVTGQLVRVGVREQIAHLVNAGHPAPLRVRREEVTVLDLHVDLPFGTLPGTPYRITSVPLRPGDRLVLTTDGLAERPGLDLPGLVHRTRDLPARLAVRELTDAAMSAAGGDLADDATAVVLDWCGAPAPGA